MTKENLTAPSFKLVSTGKEDFNLKTSVGKYIVLYFYPKDDTPGCTIETIDFNKLLPKFKKLNHLQFFFLFQNFALDLLDLQM